MLEASMVSRFPRLIGPGTLALVAAWMFPALLFGQSPAAPVSQEFVNAFVVTERAKLIDKVQKQGDKFDAAREMEKLQQKHMKVFGAPLPVAMLAEFDRAASETVPLRPDQLDPNDPTFKRNPTELRPELFLEYAKIKFMEDIREEGTRFDTPRELAKLSERFERNFGSAMPKQMQEIV